MNCGGNIGLLDDVDDVDGTFSRGVSENSNHKHYKHV